MDPYAQSFLVPLQNTLHRIVSFIPRFLVAGILLVAFSGIAAIARNVTRRSLSRVTHIPWAVRTLIVRCIYLTTIFIGILVALAAANINVTTVLASLGVAGFALGFALKDILENFIAGILLLFARPFELEDQVILGSYEGTVIDIQIRTTTLKMYSGDVVLIPNSHVFTGPVVNHTKLGKRRYSVDFDTSLTADTSLVQREALDVARENAVIMKDPEPMLGIVGLDSFNDTVSWRLYFWAATQKAVEIKTISETLIQIKRRLYDAGVPTPTVTSAMVLKRKQTGKE